MTNNEAKYMAAFLDELTDRFGNDGCNDMFLPDTPENREIVKEAEKNNPDWKLSFYETKKGEPKKICTLNIIVIDYLKNKFMQEHGIEKNDLPDTNSW